MSAYTRLVQRLGHRRWFAAVAARLAPVDGRVQRWTRGRWSLIGRHRLPSLLLTTTGRRSGLPRTQPLLYARDGADFVVTGSNFGQQQHPAWTANLLADPEATVTVDGTPVQVRAVPVDGQERERLWNLLVATWPAYTTYRQRAAGRQIRVFRLTPR